MLYTCFYAYGLHSPLSFTNMVFFTGSEFSEGNFVAKVKMEIVVEKNQVCGQFVVTSLFHRPT